LNPYVGHKQDPTEPQTTGDALRYDHILKSIEECCGDQRHADDAHQQRKHDPDFVTYGHQTSNRSLAQPQWQNQGEARASVQRACVDAAAVCFGDSPTDEQAQAVTADPLLQGGIAASVAFEDCLHFTLVQADTLILHQDLDAL